MTAHIQPMDATWEDISDITIKNCQRTTRIMFKIDEPEISEQEESESENKIVDTAMLINNLSVETNPEAQQLIHNIEEHINMIDQLATTEDVLTDNVIIKMGSPLPPITVIETVDALEKVISYQGNLEVGKGFDENELKML
ncbi:1936_t:CDS:2 [Diversispora eburnea]|uniref:1936_t:CDS:1 n=1 Tax=Diversispora eburnea TaxID=1213867 RepID=A0A9N9CKY6_9GLOM|nr:1936_t:CDS:2 [Diversispora eburnea]